MEQERIDIILLKMQELHTQHPDYEFYWEIVINHYEKMMKKLISSQNYAHGRAEDMFNEAICQMPNIINAWIPEKSKFSTFLTWRLRAIYQTFIEFDRLMPFAKHAHNHYRRKTGKPELNYNSHLEISPTLQISNQSSNQSEIDSEDFYNKSMLSIMHLPNIDMWIDFYINELTYEQIAAKHDISNMTVSNKIKKIHPKVTAIITRLNK